MLEILNEDDDNNDIKILTCLVISWFVFSHQGKSNSSGYTTQGSGLLSHIDMVPDSGMRQCRLFIMIKYD